MTPAQYIITTRQGTCYTASLTVGNKPTGDRVHIYREDPPDFALHSTVAHKLAARLGMRGLLVGSITWESINGDSAIFLLVAPENTVVIDDPAP